jgi:hypothetical protein
MIDLNGKKKVDPAVKILEPSIKLSGNIDTAVQIAYTIRSAKLQCLTDVLKNIYKTRQKAGVFMKENDDFCIEGKRVFDIVKIASHIVAATVDLPGNEAPEKQSGYLAVRERTSGRLLLLKMIGECPQDDIAKFVDFAREKGSRLIAGKDVSSWESRNPEERKWGSAIVAGGLIISFSGLKELIDEAVVLVLGLRLSWLTYGEAANIAQISGNHFMDNLYDLSKRR